jgi:cell division protein FtsL
MARSAAARATAPRPAKRASRPAGRSASRTASRPASRTASRPTGRSSKHARRSTRARKARSGRLAPAPGRRPAFAPAGAALPLLRSPFARTARAGGGRVLDALLAGRGWIALVFVLLAGIVFFNVDLLQLNRQIAAGAERASDLRRSNAALRLELAKLGSSERIQREAAEAGFVLPAPGDVVYLSTSRGDAQRALKLITAPTLEPVIPPPAEAPIVEEPVVEPTVPETTDPAAVDPATGTVPVEPDPATGAAPPPEPAPTAEPVVGETGAPIAPPAG